MPGYEGLIKYPLYTDPYGGPYGEPQWWRDLASTTRAEITAQVGVVSGIVSFLSSQTSTSLNEL